MQLDQLLDMDDEDFERVVMQAVKRREDFPHWWRAVLVPELIDATEQVVKAARDAAEVQALTPGKYPYAAGFASKMASVLAEITLSRIVGVTT